ncbi:hypothetical protein WH47_10074 [Habropoda laboriosa]|uniref:Uncharacterized protein n=1 Tax=Habropoda laboriosa TaxID=597456 RepID=A0A0L7R3T9_9HYME|nr:hypothetical protein WH47_10074 [Habropoda laboriosa]
MQNWYTLGKGISFNPLFFYMREILHRHLASPEGERGGVVWDSHPLKHPW